MATADSSCRKVMNSGLVFPPYVTIDSWMPRQEEAGLLNTKSISSDLSTSTMKSEPGRPRRVPGAACTLWVANSACASAVDGRVAGECAASTATVALPFPVAETAGAGPGLGPPPQEFCPAPSGGGVFPGPAVPPRLFLARGC